MSFQATQGIRGHPQGEKTQGLGSFIRIGSKIIRKLFRTEDKR